MTKTSVAYAYVVRGDTFTWSVAQSRAPRNVDETFTVLYLPETPSFTRPGADRAPVAAEAASSRIFAWRVAAGLVYFFGFNALLCHVRLRRLRTTRQTELNDAPGYRTRLILTAAFFAPILAAITAWSASESARRGESMWPAALVAVFSLALIGGTGFYVVREGRARAAERAARMMRWLAPIAVGSAALRALAWLLGW